MQRSANLRIVIRPPLAFRAFLLNNPTSETKIALPFSIKELSKLKSVLFSHILTLQNSAGRKKYIATHQDV